MDEQLSLATPCGICFADEAEKASDYIVSGITSDILPCLLPGTACLAADVVSTLGSVCPFQPVSKLAAAMGSELTLFSRGTSRASASLGLCRVNCSRQLREVLGELGRSHQGHVSQHQLRLQVPSPTSLLVPQPKPCEALHTKLETVPSPAVGVGAVIQDVP